MAANETIDKLKNAGYITVTDDSQGIADKCQIGGGSSEIDEYLEDHDIQYEIAGDDLYGVLDNNFYSVVEVDQNSAVFKVNDKLVSTKIFFKNFVYFHTGDEFEFSGDKEDYKLTITADYKGEDIMELSGKYEGVSVPSEYFEVSPLE